MRNFFALVLVEVAVSMFCTAGFAALVPADAALPNVGITQVSQVGFDGNDSVYAQSSLLRWLSPTGGNADSISVDHFSLRDSLAVLPSTVAFKYAVPVSLTSTDQALRNPVGNSAPDDQIHSVTITSDAIAATSVGEQSNPSSDLMLAVQPDVDDTSNLSMAVWSPDGGTGNGVHESDMLGSAFKPSAIGMLGLGGLMLLRLRRQPI